MEVGTVVVALVRREMRSGQVRGSGSSGELLASIIQPYLNCVYILLYTYTTPHHSTVDDGLQ